MLRALQVEGVRAPSLACPRLPTRAPHCPWPGLHPLAHPLQAGRARTVGKAAGKAMAAFTALRQSCCHPQARAAGGGQWQHPGVHALRSRLLWEAPPRVQRVTMRLDLLNSAAPPP